MTSKQFTKDEIAELLEANSPERDLEAIIRQLLVENGRLRDENYTDLLDQMDEAWGHGEFTVGSAEIRAFLESRIVHQPTTRLRAQVESLRGEALKGICVYCGEVQQYESLEQKASDDGNQLRIEHIKNCPQRPELKLIAELTTAWDALTTANQRWTRALELVRAKADEWEQLRDELAGNVPHERYQPTIDALRELLTEMEQL